MEMDINYALVESKRPTIYTAMKYWGKKPHNIWNAYINNYVADGGVYLDAFCGSGISAIEGIKQNKKVIAFDINPLSSFLIELYTTKFDVNAFRKEALTIIETIRQDELYKKMWCYDGEYHNFKYNNNEIYEICKADKTIYYAPTNEDLDAIKYAESIDLCKLGINYIDEAFLDSGSFSANFINNVGGNNFKYLWTKRNLIILSLIFSNILKLEDDVVKKQLLFGFIMIVHLCCKMNIPRRDGANRHFSTSWGRSAYVCAKRQMEQNPLLLFERNCFQKQGVEKSLLLSNSYIEKDNLKIKYVTNSNKQKNSSDFNLKYGIVNVLELDSYVMENSVDFIMTDPPYGGLVQYLDLSYIWLIWLKHYDSRYGNISFAGEITINKHCNQQAYKSRFTESLMQLHKVLKDDGKIVFTFHNKNIPIWNIFISSIRRSGFIIEKIIHQKNRRSGESAVANPYGTSGTDFYIRCKKNPSINDVQAENIVSRNLNQNIIDIAIKSIVLRNEPTPYEILFDAILAEITSSGLFFSDDCDGDIKKALNSQIDKIFIITKSDDGLSNLWWLKNINKYATRLDIPLNERVDKLVLSILKNNGLVKLDDILGAVYQQFPNGLTPDESSILKSLKKFGKKANNAWTYDSNTSYSGEATLHTRYISYLAKIGRNLGYDIFIGKREQQDTIHNKKLIDYATIRELNFITDAFTRERVSMIDIIFIKNNVIQYLFEVENSTSIISALHRASVLNDNNIKKYIVIPSSREKQLLSMQEPLFKETFVNNKWNYLLYEDLDKLESTNTPKIENFSKSIR